MNDILIIIITSVTSILASGGFWAYLQSRPKKEQAADKMLLGLAHDRIMYLASLYLSKGSITKDQYENLHKYMYIPYKELGGNGMIDKMMRDIDKLPIATCDILQQGGEQ